MQIAISGRWRCLQAWCADELWLWSVHSGDAAEAFGATIAIVFCAQTGTLLVVELGTSAVADRQPGGVVRYADFLFSLMASCVCVFECFGRFVAIAGVAAISQHDAARAQRGRRRIYCAPRRR